MPEHEPSKAIGSADTWRSPCFSTPAHSKQNARKQNGESLSIHHVQPSGSLATSRIIALLSSTHFRRSSKETLSTPAVLAPWIANHLRPSAPIGSALAACRSPLVTSLPCGLNAGIA